LPFESKTMTLLFLHDIFKIQLKDAIDILLVAIILYQFYRLIKGTTAINIFLGIVSVYIFYKIVKAMHMELLGEILSAFISVGFIALIVVFQPEIRKFLFLLGTPNFITQKHRRFLFWKLRLSSSIPLDIETLVNTCTTLASTNTGALIVIARQNELNTFVETGERIDSNLSGQLLQNIFFKNSPMHDGAVIIRENRIVAARCILPVTGNQDLPVHYGTRHRAAIGITEQSDAIALVVSEQTGKISMCIQGELKTDLTAVTLTRALEEAVQNGN
jgi:diadenylate cyclase